MYQDFLPVAIFIGLAVVLLVAPLIIQYIVSPRFNKEGEKLEIYECGEIPEGSAWVQFNIRFYIIALIFIIFDVEVVFLFPWAVVFKDLGLIAFIEVMIFLGILVVGFAYVWSKGDLDWVKMKLKYAAGRYADLGTEEGKINENI
ncbi:MAG: NADH-quinone oxidoreductase subunit A [Candidatus Marinimicrobia bacterium]|nr:NADH-quinone oxidoreductase subunit A [Candidatus Neomarinimicrobiota bacterium]|tara:strand:- start:204 stop:638 length:435 start_codon:yes stop_codon:yes gene_type:complete